MSKTISEIASTLNGSCHCGNIRFYIESNVNPSSFSPRECDCDFCQKHGVQYFSDNDGSLSFAVKDETRIQKYKTGNRIADFLVCSDCGVMVGIVLILEEGKFGAVNCRAIDGNQVWGDPMDVSPQCLSEEQKISRWKSAWFANVSIQDADLMTLLE
ncbi:MAG: aldehyde-activating protein [Gammaproteobacteria bacterium]|nr:aldehyde-activating protein [Gammaproteobacteria bacterium]